MRVRLVVQTERRCLQSLRELPREIREYYLIIVPERLRELTEARYGAPHRVKVVRRRFRIYRQMVRRDQEYHLRIGRHAVDPVRDRAYVSDVSGERLGRIRRLAREIRHGLLIMKMSVLADDHVFVTGSRVVLRAHRDGIALRLSVRLRRDRKPGGPVDRDSDLCGEQTVRGAHGHRLLASAYRYRAVRLRRSEYHDAVGIRMNDVGDGGR